MMLKVRGFLVQLKMCFDLKSYSEFLILAVIDILHENFIKYRIYRFLFRNNSVPQNIKLGK